VLTLLIVFFLIFFFGSVGEMLATDPMEWEAKQHEARNKRKEKRREKQAKNNYNH
jgi:hypothetical protein|tara:strand:- start:208 stop:372 length:165 start_codon:yes stop_codon:yes gene_type:complete